MANTELRSGLSYEDTLTFASPLDDAVFRSDLLYRTNKTELIEVIQRGSADTKRVAWKRVALEGDVETLKIVEGLIGKVPATWMEQSHQLYSVEDIKLLLNVNSLAIWDVPEIRYRLTGDINSFRPPKGPSYKNWVSMGRPILNLIDCDTIDAIAISLNIPDEDVLFVNNPAVPVLARYSPISLLKVPLYDVLAQSISYTPLRGYYSLLTQEEVMNLCRIYGEDINKTMFIQEVLLGIRPNYYDIDGTIPVFSDVDWLVKYAPWVVLTSSLEVQLLMVTYPQPFYILMERGSSNLSVILLRLDPVRGRLADILRQNVKEEEERRKKEAEQGRMVVE